MNSLLLSFKEKLEKKEMVFGPFMKTCDPAFVEVAGYAGFDFVILDMEHGPASLETMQHLIRAATIGNTVPIVRVPELSESKIGQVLDIGAMGVQVPQVQTLQQAKQAIHAAKFHPEGERGVCRFVRTARYSALEKGEYFRKANQALVVLQLEGKEAIENLDDILTVKGIDILFIGPYDLSQSLGVPGQVTHPTVMEKMANIKEKAKERGICVGTFTDTIKDAKHWHKAGVQYISYSVDVGLFLDMCQNLIHQMKN
jgi:4-hydroxy-2-oxoheptanedioate aldolase